MKIALPVAENRLCMHFGHCETFIIADVDASSKSIIDKKELTPPPHEPGVLPQWLKEQKVDLIIAGGMGKRAQQFFHEYGIKVITGAPADHPQTILLHWLNDTLVTGDNVCDH